MKLAAIHPGALVKCKKPGREFSAYVTGKPAGGKVAVAPVDRGITYRLIRAREVVEVLAPATPHGQMSLVGSEAA